MSSHRGGYPFSPVGTEGSTNWGQQTNAAPYVHPTEDVVSAELDRHRERTREYIAALERQKMVEAEGKMEDSTLSHVGKKSILDFAMEGQQNSSLNRQLDCSRYLDERDEATKRLQARQRLKKAQKAVIAANRFARFGLLAATQVKPIKTERELAREREEASKAKALNALNLMKKDGMIKDDKEAKVVVAAQAQAPTRRRSFDRRSWDRNPVASGKNEGDGEAGAEGEKKKDGRKEFRSMDELFRSRRSSRRPSFEGMPANIMDGAKAAGRRSFDGLKAVRRKSFDGMKDIGTRLANGRRPSVATDENGDEMAAAAGAAAAAGTADAIQSAVWDGTRRPSVGHRLLRRPSLEAASKRLRDARPSLTRVARLSLDALKRIGRPLLESLPDGTKAAAGATAVAPIENALVEKLREIPKPISLETLDYEPDLPDDGDDDDDRGRRKTIDPDRFKRGSLGSLMPAKILAKSRADALVMDADDDLFDNVRSPPPSLEPSPGGRALVPVQHTKKKTTTHFG